jgi:hypothetical protein
MRSFQVQLRSEERLVKKLVIAIAVTVVVALGSAVAWQAQASAPAAPVAHPYTPVQQAGCGGRDVNCPPGSHWVCGPYGQRCWCTPC